MKVVTGAAKENRQEAFRVFFHITVKRYIKQEVVSFPTQRGTTAGSESLACTSPVGPGEREREGERERASEGLPPAAKLRRHIKVVPPLGDFKRFSPSVASPSSPVFTLGTHEDSWLRAQVLSPP